MKARNPNSADPAASPSRPSVTFTAFVVAHTMTDVQMTHRTGDSCHPGKSKRVKDSVSLTPVPRSSHVIITTTRPKVIWPFFFQKIPRLCARRTFRKSSRKPITDRTPQMAHIIMAWSDRAIPPRRCATAQPTNADIMMAIPPIVAVPCFFK